MLTKTVHYREKAGRLLQKAVGAKSPAAMNRIDAIAARYDRLAAKIEASNQDQLEAAVTGRPSIRVAEVASYHVA